MNATKVWWYWLARDGGGAPVWSGLVSRWAAGDDALLIAGLRWQVRDPAAPWAIDWGASHRGWLREMGDPAPVLDGFRELAGLGPREGWWT